MYELGDGVEVDYPKAIEWYLKAANHGLIHTMVLLGHII
jgi:TPR repeat protein